jgi:SET domain-containing protein
MFRFFRHKKTAQPVSIEIKPSPIHGRGVFACKSFKPGDHIETAPVVLLEKQEKELLQSTTLFSYYFLVENENTPVALGFGYSSLYNHAPIANAVYKISLKNATMIITACQPIDPGDEIKLNYNGRPDDETPVYFLPDTVL